MCETETKRSGCGSRRVVPGGASLGQDRLPFMDQTLPSPPLPPTTTFTPVLSPARTTCLARYPDVYIPPSTAEQSTMGTSSLPARTVCPLGRYRYLCLPPHMPPRLTATVGPAGPNAARSSPCSARIWSCASALVGNMSSAQASGSSDRACGDGRGPGGGVGGVDSASQTTPHLRNCVRR